MRIHLQPGFILHHRHYRETSLLLDVFTPDHGRLALVAKGVRIARSHTRALLQPFRPLIISCQGRGELMTLSSVEPTAPPIPLRQASLLSGFYLNEILLRLLPKEDPHPRLYTIYHQTLLDLAKSGLEQKILRLFEKNLLAEIGYGLQLQGDRVTGQVFEADKIYRFMPEQGFEKEEVAMQSMYHFSGKSLLALANETLDDQDSLRDAKRLIRLALNPLLGTHTLHSRKLFMDVETA